MHTKDEVTRHFFKHSSVHVLLCPRSAREGHSWLKKKVRTWELRNKTAQAMKLVRFYDKNPELCMLLLKRLMLRIHSGSRLQEQLHQLLVLRKMSSSKLKKAKSSFPLHLPLSSPCFIQEAETIYTHHQKTVIVDADAGNNKRKLIAFVGGLDLCLGRYDTPCHPIFRTLDTMHKDDYHNGTFTVNIQLSIPLYSAPNVPTEM